MSLYTSARNTSKDEMVKLQLPSLQQKTNVDTLGPASCFLWHRVACTCVRQRRSESGSVTLSHPSHYHFSSTYIYSDTARSRPLSIMSELKDCPPLKYYDFKPVEHVKVCPRYTAVLGRSEDDGIGIEELDTLQLELETLLSSASRRLRALEEQRQVGDWHQFCFIIAVPSWCL